MSDYYLRACDLSAGYQGHVVLKHMEFGLNRGEILTLIGPNGAGKSTLLKTIAGLLAPAAGTVFLDGRTLADMRRGDLAKQLAVVFTERLRTELMTCRDVVATGRYPYTGPLGLLSKADYAAVDEAMKLVAVEELAEKDFSRLSDGQRQRVMLARAVCQEPEIILLDEPTSFLDIRYKLEFLEILRNMTRQKNLTVVMSLHELELAKRISDKVLCIGEGGIDRFGTPGEVFRPGYIAALFHVDLNSALAEDYISELESRAGRGNERAAEPESRAGRESERTAEPESKTAGESTSERRKENTGKPGYRMVNQRQLRCGVTTGTCAAAAAGAAAAMLLEGISADMVSVHTPKGLTVQIPVESAGQGEGFSEYFVVKDSGDDPDVTNGTKIYARVERLPEGTEGPAAAFQDERYPGLYLDGGPGVGRVTKSGLEQAIGQAAINRVPREMIFSQVEKAIERQETSLRLLITVSAPEGETLAKKTFNPILGIEGGISVLGTSGILEPMSERAIVDTIETQIRQKGKLGEKSLLVTPGNYGQGYVADYLGFPVAESIKCSNYVGETIDLAVSYGMEELLLVGNIGKLVKLAAGIMNTHSKTADGRAEIMAMHTALCGGSREQLEQLISCITTEEMLRLLEEWGLRKSVMDSICRRIGVYVKRRAGEQLKAGVMLFSENYGFLGQTQGTEEVLQSFRRNKRL